jgi:hypothetical protein
MHSRLEAYLSEVAGCLGALPAARRAEEVREVHAHLGSAVTAMRERGASEAEAMSTVLEQFGPADAVARGLAAAWRRGEQKRKVVMMKQRMIFGGSLAAVILASAWLMFVATMIGGWLHPEGQIVIRASEGSRLAVQNGVVQVLDAGSRGAGVEGYNLTLLTVLVSVPFGLIVGFALVGCGSLLRARRAA